MRNVTKQERQGTQGQQQGHLRAHTHRDNSRVTPSMLRRALLSGGLRTLRRKGHLLSLTLILPRLVQEAKQQLLAFTGQWTDTGI